MIDYVYLFLYKIFALLAKLLPKLVMDGILRGLSWFVYTVDGKHRHIIDANLKLAFGEHLTQAQRDRIGQHTFYNLLQNIIGFMGRNGYSKEKLLEKITFKNASIVENAIINNQKIIFITGHYSNWEMLPPLLTAKFGMTLVGIGRKLDSKVMDKVLIANREKYNVEMLYRKGAIKGGMKALKEGKALGLLVDQHLGAKQGGIEVTFFGHSVLHSPAASVLARSMDAVIIPVFISTENYDHYTVTFYDPILPIKTDNKEGDIVQMTQAQADIMEQVIRNKPDEWFWVHKRWKGCYLEIYQR
ncbi:MAG: lipid A biosynthesis acyltransferase [Campylobacterales bacterium]|nr:lipid A biosynthesis acyltransferase [Campylobacterales bacterium]